MAKWLMKLMHGHCQCIQLSNEGFGDTTDIISSGIQAVLLFVFARWTYQMNNKSFSLRNTVVSCFRSFDISRYIVLRNSYPKKFPSIPDYILYVWISCRFSRTMWFERQFEQEFSFESIILENWKSYFAHYIIYIYRPISSATFLMFWWYH